MSFWGEIGCFNLFPSSELWKMKTLVKSNKVNGKHKLSFPLSDTNLADDSRNSNNKFPIKVVGIRTVMLWVLPSYWVSYLSKWIPGVFLTENVTKMPLCTVSKNGLKNILLLLFFFHTCDLEWKVSVLRRWINAISLDRTVQQSERCDTVRRL